METILASVSVSRFGFPDLLGPPPVFSPLFSVDFSVFFPLFSVDFSVFSLLFSVDFSVSKAKPSLTGLIPSFAIDSLVRAWNVMFLNLRNVFQLVQRPSLSLDGDDLHVGRHKQSPPNDLFALLQLFLKGRLFRKCAP